MKLGGVDDARRARVAAVLHAAGGERSPLVAAARPALAASVDAGSVVLVEGISDQLAVEALARRLGRDLLDEGIAVVPSGGATTFGRFLEVFGPRGSGVRLAGLCDVAEAPAVRRHLERAGLGVVPSLTDMERLGFYVCDPDLEEVLMRALPAATLLGLVESAGDGRSFRTFRQQPAQRHRSFEQQLHRFMGTQGGRKIRYAPQLVEAIPTERLPRALTGVLSHI